MPILYTGLAVAIFGSVGASLVVVSLLRPGRLASLSIALGFLISVAVTLSRGAGTYDKILNSAERQTMLGVSAFGALVGIAIGAIAIGSPSRLGFLGLLAVFPVASLVAVVLGIGGDHRWLTRGALLVLLVLIGWSRWFGILFWPVFFALFWLLTLVVAAVESGAQTLRHPWDGHVSVRTVTDAMLDFAGSAWRELLGSSWELFWPAAAFAALVVAGVHAWRRTGASPA